MCINVSFLRLFDEGNHDHPICGFWLIVNAVSSCTNIRMVHRIRECGEHYGIISDRLIQVSGEELTSFTLVQTSKLKLNKHTLL